MQTKIIIVVGARPNFMKAFPLVQAAQKLTVNAVLVHTGQHYSASMSNVFFKDLTLPEPKYNLDIGSGSHSEVTVRCIERLEPVFIKEQPSLVIVVGDVNSTLAGAVVAAKLGIPVAHVEAGLRSFDRSMPEEINRIVTDSVSNEFFVSEPAGVANLIKEGHPENKIHLVGNVMIDTLDYFLPIVQKCITPKQLGENYALVTLHRPSNVDKKERLQDICHKLIEVSHCLPVVFPVHPRTKYNLVKYNLWNTLSATSTIRLEDPVGYLDFISWMVHAKLVITDSGGIQEETTALGIPCLTMRDNTERPITVEVGTNRLVGSTGDKLLDYVNNILVCNASFGSRPPLWDGHAAERIMNIILEGAYLAKD